jgi:hypothetical protein
MKRSFILTILSTLILTGLFAQDRYLEEVFTKSEIKVTSDVHYATNATILGLLFNPNVNEFIPEPLFMDVYEPDPAVDTVTNRPVVVVVHGGDGLPRLANNACWGDKIDSVTVSTAMKLAKMGFVAVAPNYRLGWNPLTTRQDDFLDGLVDAAVRINQDLKACARYLRKNVAEDGNTYGIHPDQIAIWGTASTAGTYSGFAAYINDISEVQTPTFFVTDSAGNIRNTFNEMEAGDLEGLTVGMTAGGDTTNYINTPGYSSAFQLTALGSAISLDSGILDAGEPPMIMFGNPKSVVTQFDEGPIQLPTTGQVVAFVQLSGGLIKDANNVGLNDGWAGLTDTFTLAQQADPNFGAVEGWLPLYGDADNEYPWVHWDRVNCPLDSASNATAPGSDRLYALSQIDTMAGYFGVRACVTFGLGCPGITSVEDQVLDQKLVTLSPNPTTGTIRIEAAEGQRMKDVEVYSFDGRLVRQFSANATMIQEDLSGLSSGLYSIRVWMNDGFVVKKLLLNN